LSTFAIPRLQIDPHSLPAPITTSEPDSFAQRTFQIRIPHIIEETMMLNSFPGDVCNALETLETEILGGSIRALQEATPDKVFWDQVSRPYLGHTWLDVPWYWAEAFFYRRVLEATHYFQPGAWHHFDPYAAKKQTEWVPEAAPRSLNTVLEELPSEPGERFEKLLYASLWGNRTDLSHNLPAQEAGAARLEHRDANLLVDDAGRVRAYLHQRPGRLVIITDNAGTELLMDLALADLLLSEGMAAHLALHLKPQPLFVSDAMPRDVEVGLGALATAGKAARVLGDRVRTHLETGRLQLRAHWFYATSLFYFQLPPDLGAELRRMDLVILKGDVNYRRLLGDAHWPPTTPFKQAIAYFPAPCVALRTLKAELVVGLRSGQAERRRAQDPDWLVNGRYGLIQARL
jgi:uncharacterized protein with ATP-grasp and redox domains